MTDWSVMIAPMPRMAAKDRDALGETRRDQILEAAIRLWLRGGFDATSVEAIAREAGLGKGTVYLYFPTKDAILDEAVRRYSLLSTLGELTHLLEAAPPEKAIPGIVSGLWTTLRERAPLIGLVLREVPLRPENARTFIEKVVLPTNRLLADYLEAGVASGDLRPLNTFVAARALVGMLVVFLLTQEVFGGRALSPLSDEAITKTVSDLFLHGACAAVKNV
jgi:AcrR family transcriptional regulator